MMNENAEKLIAAIKKSRYVVAFTGAGISAEAGIPTYRGEGGLWDKYDPSLYANVDYFLQDPSYYWNFFREVRYPLLKKAGPSRGHLALAEMEAVGNLKTVITQNIDGLHQLAGSSSVVELHGSTRVIFCMNCSQKYTMEKAFSLLMEEFPPRCSKCQGRLRPDVVFFGESLNPHVLRSAYEEAEKCDMMLVSGSSLVVYPAAEIPLVAKRNGATLVIINKEKTGLDHEADLLIQGKAGDVLPQIIQSLRE
jgi:NAD-dependent deacetylase